MNTAKRATIWRSAEPLPGSDMVEIPRALALDLVKCLGLSHFIHAQGFSEKDLDEGRHEEAHQRHLERMQRLEFNISAHLGDEGLTPSADLILRSLSIAYESAAEIPA